MGKHMTDITIDTIEQLELPYEAGDTSYEDSAARLLDFIRWDSQLTGVVNDEIVDQRRWYTTYRDVYQLPSGRYIEVIHDRGSTEMQEDGSMTINEVRPTQVTVTEYRRVR